MNQINFIHSFWVWSTLVFFAVPAFAGSGQESGKPRVAFVTNGVASFWRAAQSGALTAATDFQVEVEVHMPTSGIADQNRIVEKLLEAKVDGIAISPIDPQNQLTLINRACSQTSVITQDVDAPQSERRCYVGMDNYRAGRLCATLVKEALPNGGEVAIFVGRLELQAARDRFQGLVDELKGRPSDERGDDDPTQPIDDDQYPVIGVFQDRFDLRRAVSLAEDALAADSDLGCMVGLFAYNGPVCLQAVRQADKIGTIKLVCFDEDDRVLEAIKAGSIHATVVQDPFKIGYESVRVLAALVGGDESVPPKDGWLRIPFRAVRQRDVDAFTKDLNSKRQGQPLRR